MCNWFRPLNLILDPEILCSGVGGMPLVSLARSGLSEPGQSRWDSACPTAVAFRIFIGGSWVGSAEG